MLDQVGRQERVEPRPRKTRQLSVEIDRLPTGVQGPVLALVQINPVKVQVRARRFAPAAPMRQSPGAGA